MMPLPHADGADDVACSPVPVAHDESAHYVGPGSAPAQTHADHCFLCHTLRSFHSAFDAFQQHSHARDAERLQLARIDRAEAIEWSLVPGRAPPA